MIKGLRVIAQKKIGSKWLPIRQKKIWLNPVIFLLRKSAFVFITVALVGYPNEQAIFHLFTCIAYIIFLGRSDVFSSKLEKFAQIATEFMVGLIVFILRQFLTVKDMQDTEIETLNAIFFVLLVGATVLNMTTFTIISVLDFREKNHDLKMKEYRSLIDGQNTREVQHE